MRYYLYFPGNSDGTESAWNAGDLGLILGSDPWVGKIFWRREWQPTPVFLPGEFHGQRSLLGCSPWGLKELDTTKQLTLSQMRNWGLESLNSPLAPVAQRLKRLPAMSQEDPLEKEMATHSSIFAWRIPWMEEPGGLPFMGSHRVGHEWSDLAAAAAAAAISVWASLVAQW